ncbi:MAG: hypothetical protein WCI71_02530 [Bacteroidota bacterium]
MKTESEQHALQLAKKVFEHFTHDSLAIAREIIALEQESEEDQNSSVTIPVSFQPVAELQNTDNIIVKKNPHWQQNPAMKSNCIRVAEPTYQSRTEQAREISNVEYEEVPY